MIRLNLNLSAGEPKQLLQALGTISASIAFAFGYLQWRAARHEVSFDKYYDKLDTANKRFDAWRVEALKVDPNQLHEHLNDMFIFAELDNLEYVLEKYKLGYVKKELTQRAIRTFRSRCEDSTNFCDRAIHWVAKAKGYERTTRETVNYIVTQKTLI